MGRTSDRERSGFGGAMRWAVPSVAAAMLAPCVAVALPVPIVTGPALEVGPFSTRSWLDGTHTRVARYDPNRMSAEQAEDFVRQDCADEGLTFDTLRNNLPPRGTPTRGAPEAGESTITYTCRQ